MSQTDRDVARTERRNERRARQANRRSADGLAAMLFFAWLMVIFAASVALAGGVAWRLFTWAAGL